MGEKTASICPVCYKTVEAERVRELEGIYLVRHCPEHGLFKTLIWKEMGLTSLDWKQWSPESEIITSEAIDLDCPHHCEACQSHQQEACCVLIELTQNCNQNCQFCFAKSSDDKGEDLGLDEIEGMYDFLLEKSGKRPFNIQLSGGEPTLYKDLEAVVRMGREKGFPYLQLNTNGCLLGEDPKMAERLKQAGLSSVFLQFDGIEDSIYKKMRGKASFEAKRKAIKNCKRAGLGVTLVVTVVKGINDEALGEILDFALKNTPVVRGIHFQPVSYFGRVPEYPENADRLTLPEFLLKLVDQSWGQFKLTDFIPLGTGHPRCSFHGNFILEGGQLRASAGRKISSCCGSIEDARDYIKKKWTCRGLEEPEDQWDQIIKMINLRSFSVTAMGFQDQWNLDLERLKKCRVAIATKDKKLIPFCAYNILYRS